MGADGTADVVDVAISPDALLSTSSPRDGRPEQNCTARGSSSLRQAVCPSSPRSESAQNPLPDLTDRIVSMGLYPQYQRFRQDYLAWRGGGVQGARGEHTAAVFAGGATRGLQRWYPTYAVWKWRRTISFWIAVFFLQGSLLFTGASVIGTLPNFFATDLKALTALPFLWGGAFFTAGSYLMCLETMNVMRSDEVWCYSPFAWKAIVHHLDRLPGMTRKPFYASLFYFVGTLVYAVPLVVGLFPDGLLPSLAETLLSPIPYTLGGALFSLAGCFEYLETRSRPRTLSFGGAVVNVIGSFLFFIGGALPLWDYVFASNVVFAVGSLMFTVSSTTYLIMWKDEQYGLSFLSVLNEFSGGQGGFSSDEDSSAKFSIRGLCFVILNCLLSVVASFNAFLEFEQIIKTPALREGTSFCNALLTIVLSNMALVLNSAVVQMPKVQPYHALIVSLRWTSICMGVNAGFIFAIDNRWKN